MAALPKHYTMFKSKYPRLWQAHDTVSAAAQEAGPLDEKARELVKLGLSIGARMEGAVHSHTRRALEVGVSPAEIRHAVLLGLTTIGFPSTMAALTWVEDILKRPVKARRARGK
ncbi:MAG TPA: carboxymuconolactone decarboxylase family protein [Candidatus Acidoferrales bacterium]|nr:carboxymuconolactone decarboxylase family protein [Candidatus Acidoferrales bacterium]